LDRHYQKTRSISLRLPDEVYSRLIIEARESDSTLTRIVKEKISNTISLESIDLKIEDAQKMETRRWSKAVDAIKSLSREVAELKQDLARLNDVTSKLCAIVDQKLEEPQGLSNKIKGLFSRKQKQSMPKKRKTRS